VNPKCEVCRSEVSKSSDAAYEILCWETQAGLSAKEYTGRVAHLVCLHGGEYDSKQLTIAEAIEMKENE